jgi:hypothetical protein
LVTIILAVVAPVDHKYVVPGLDVNVILPPSQKIVGPLAVIIGVAGKAFTVTAADAETTL